MQNSPTIFINNDYHLAVPNSGDGAALVTHLNNENIVKWLSDGIPQPYHLSDIDDWLRICAAQEAHYNQPISFHIKQTATQTCVGGCSLHHLGDKGSLQPEIGYWLAEPFWQRGIATAAVAALCGYAREAFALNEVYAFILDGNIGSANVLLKNNFIYQKSTTDHLLKNGKPVLTHQYRKKL